MLKKTAALFLMVALAWSMSALSFAQDSKKAGKVEGRVTRYSTEKSTITVRKASEPEKVVHYDNYTQWTSQYHGDKKANIIDSTQVKDGDYVICSGWYDDKGDFHAGEISKRLSHSLGK